MRTKFNQVSDAIRYGMDNDMSPEEITQDLYDDGHFSGNLPDPKITGYIGMDGQFAEIFPAWGYGDWGACSGDDDPRIEVFANGSRLIMDRDNAADFARSILSIAEWNESKVDE